MTNVRMQHPRDRLRRRIRDRIIKQAENEDRGLLHMLAIEKMMMVK